MFLNPFWINAPLPCFLETSNEQNVFDYNKIIIIANNNYGVRLNTVEIRLNSNYGVRLQRVVFDIETLEQVNKVTGNVVAGVIGAKRKNGDKKEN